MYDTSKMPYYKLMCKITSKPIHDQFRSRIDTFNQDKQDDLIEEVRMNTYLKKNGLDLEKFEELEQLVTTFNLYFRK